MLIQRMTVFSGKDQEQILNLSPGLNLIQLSDPQLRDAWSRLPAAVLYGTSHPALSVRQGPSGARLDCRTDQGDLRLIRACTPRTGPAGLLRVFQAGTDEPIPDLSDPRCGRDLLGVDPRLFQALFPLHGMPPPYQVALEQAEDLSRSRRQQAEHLQQALNDDQIPSNETIARLRGAAVNLETTRRGVEKAREERDAVMKDLLKTEAALGETPFAGVSAEKLRRRPPELARFHPSPLFFAGLGLLAGLGGARLLLPAFFLRVPSPIYWGAWGAALAALCGVSLFQFLRDRRRKKKQLEKQFGTADLRQIKSLTDTYIELWNTRDKTQDLLQEKSKAADDLYAELLANEQAFLLEVRRFAPDACDLASADRLLRDCAIRRKALHGAQAAARSAQQQLDQLQSEDPAPGRPSTVQLTEAALRESGARVEEDLLIRRAEEILSELNAQSQSDSPALLYLAVRLALLDLSLPQEREVPWILEDPLTELDASSAAALLSWLKGAAQHRQILLFTGDDRPAAFFAGDGEVSLQQLTEDHFQV